MAKELLYKEAKYFCTYFRFNKVLQPGTVQTLCH